MKNPEQDILTRLDRMEQQLNKIEQILYQITGGAPDSSNRAAFLASMPPPYRAAYLAGEAPDPSNRAAYLKYIGEVGPEILLWRKRKTSKPKK